MLLVSEPKKVRCREYPTLYHAVKLHIKVNLIKFVTDETAHHIHPVKRIVVLLLIPIVLLQSFATLWISVGFYANRDFIAKTRCENRFTLNNSCLGQCVLMKKLKEQEEKERQQPDIKFKEALLFNQQLGVVNLLRPSTDQRTGPQPLYRESLHVHTFFASIFRPPAA